jgi:hypothetical protein
MTTATMRAVRMSPEGYAAQRLDVSLNNRGHWLLTYWSEESGVMLQILTDDQVSEWPLLSPTTEGT